MLRALLACACATAALELHVDSRGGSSSLRQKQTFWGCNSARVSLYRVLLQLLDGQLLLRARALCVCIEQVGAV